MNNCRYRISELSGVYIVEFERLVEKKVKISLFKSEIQKTSQWVWFQPLFFHTLEDARKFIAQRKEKITSEWKAIEIIE